MTPNEVDETVAILNTMMTALYGTLAAATGAPAADLYYAIGDLQANAAILIRSGVWGAQVLNVFDLSVSAGATVASMELVRLAMLAETPQSPTAIALANVGAQMALAEEVKILAATTFSSRQQADAVLVTLNSAFDAAEEYAADSGDSASYQALIAARAAAVRDLTTRARPLPNLITYSFPRVMTSHALANRLYGDASRCDELVAEGQVINPAFMPLSGPALTE